MIEFNQLKQFICICEEGTISKAAEKLIISQPALSRSMQKLESELDVQLFEHHKNNVIPNKNGKLLLSKARKIVEETDAMIKDVKDFSASHRTITVFSCTPAPLWDIEPILKRLYPEAKIVTEVIDISELIPSLKKNACSFVITPFATDDPDMISYLYMEEDLCLCVPKDHRLAKKEEITFAEADGETMIVYNNVGFWHDIHERNMPHTKFILQGDRASFKEIVKSSSLPSFTTNLSLKREGMMENKAVIPITDEEAHVSFYLTIPKKDRRKYQQLTEYIDQYYDY